MMEYWENGFCNTAMAGKLSAEGGTTIKLTMDHILLKPTIPLFHHSTIPLFHC
jgi:hypothetical protein